MLLLSEQLAMVKEQLHAALQEVAALRGDAASLASLVPPPPPSPHSATASTAAAQGRIDGCVC